MTPNVGGNYSCSTVAPVRPRRSRKKFAGLSPRKFLSRKKFSPSRTRLAGSDSARRTLPKPWIRPRIQPRIRPWIRPRTRPRIRLWIIQKNSLRLTFNGFDLGFDFGSSKKFPPTCIELLNSFLTANYLKK